MKPKISKCFPHKTVLVASPDGRRIIGDTGMGPNGFNFTLPSGAYHLELVGLCVDAEMLTEAARGRDWDLSKVEPDELVILSSMAVTLEPEVAAAMDLAPPPSWLLDREIGPREAHVQYGRVS